MADSGTPGGALQAGNGGAVEGSTGMAAEDVAGTTEAAAAGQGPCCGNCRAWRFYPEPSPYEGQCRRHAPRAHIDKIARVTATVWPVTVAADWCAEWLSAEGPR